MNPGNLSEECPQIPNLEDLASTAEIAEALKISKITLMSYRFREEPVPALPYIRFGNTIYFSKTQVAWWLNQYQIWSIRRFNDRRSIQSRHSKEMMARRKGK